MKDIVIFGTGGFGREVHQLIEDVNAQERRWNVLGWLDGNPAQHGQEIHGLPVLGGPEWLAGHGTVAVIVAVGGTAAKRRIVQSLGQQTFATLVHPTVRLGSRVRVGEGCILCAGTQVTTNIDFQEHVIVKLSCTVGHDTVLERYVTVAPGVNISGNVVVGEGVDLGTGSRIIQGLHVGEWSVIGAGAVVSKAVPANVTAVGIPARVIKEREPGWHLK